MSVQHTRRSLLGAAVALPVLAVSYVPLSAAAAPAATDARFMRIYSLWQRADAIEQAHFAAVWEPANEIYERLVAAVPHRECPTTFTNWNGEQHRYTTGGCQVNMARQIVADHEKRGHPDNEVKDPQFLAACRWLIQADDERQAEIRAIGATSGLDAASARDEQLGDRRYALEWAAIECPVTTLAALAIKCRLVARHPDCDPHEHLAADILRMAGETAA